MMRRFDVIQAIILFVLFSACMFGMGYAFGKDGAAGMNIYMLENTADFDAMSECFVSGVESVIVVARNRNRARLFRPFYEGGEFLPAWHADWHTRENEIREQREIEIESDKEWKEEYGEDYPFLHDEFLDAHGEWPHWRDIKPVLLGKAARGIREGLLMTRRRH